MAALNNEKINFDALAEKADEVIAKSKVSDRKKRLLMYTFNSLMDASEERNEAALENALADFEYQVADIQRDVKAARLPPLWVFILFACSFVSLPLVYGSYEWRIEGRGSSFGYPREQREFLWGQNQVDTGAPSYLQVRRHLNQEQTLVECLLALAAAGVATSIGRLVVKRGTPLQQTS